MKPRSSHRGYFLLQTLIFGAIAIIIIAGLVAFASANARLGRRSVLSEQAFQIAESGLEYYRWHLAHAPTDYTDGTGQSGPYTRDIYDTNGHVVGSFSLTITPPPIGSTLVTIRSEGRVSSDPTVKRTIISQLAIPSFANFAAITDAAMRFGEDTEVYGPIHSNNGIRFDGLAHNLVTSSLPNYNDPDHTGNNEFGVHTHVNPPPGSGVNDSFRSLEAPSNLVQQRNDVFLAGRSFPAPVINFNAITADLSQMKTDAQNSGRYFGASGAQGYKIVLKTNDTFDLHKVNSLMSPPNRCTNTANQTGWGTWSTNATTFLANYPIPANGLIFLEDHIWVEGTIDTARVTIIAARLPDSASQRKSITINNDIQYTNYDGRDVVALIAQDNVNVGMASGDNLRIDAALVAEKGRVGRFYYENDCGPYDDRSSITLYGTIITALRYGFAYTDGSGYATRNIIYDSFLLYNPPPSFPKTEQFHEVISWKEVR